MTDFETKKQEILSQLRREQRVKVVGGKVYEDFSEASKALDQLYLEELLRLSRKFTTLNEAPLEAIPVEAIKELLK